LIGPPKALDAPKPISSIKTITTLGAFGGAFTSKRGGAFASRASSTVDSGQVGSLMGKTVRSRPLESVAPRTMLGCSTAPVRATTAVSSNMPLMRSLCLKLCISFCLIGGRFFQFSLTLLKSAKIAHLTLDLDVVPSAAKFELINALPKRSSSYV
jgi:hypothetical protein